jgi:hypothetical protein
LTTRPGRPAGARLEDLVAAVERVPAGDLVAKLVSVAEDSRYRKPLRWQALRCVAGYMAGQIAIDDDGRTAP